MADRVSESGRVLGIDKNIRYIEHLNRPPIEVREGRLQDIELCESFDLIHARYFFIHNENAQALLARLSDALSADGVLVAEEPDFSAAKWIDDRYCLAGNRVNRAICAMFSDAGLDPAYGSRVPLDMLSSGLQVEHIDALMHLCRGGSGIARVMAESTTVLKNEYLATGEVDHSDIEEYCKGAHDSNSLACYYATVSTIARKSG